MRPLPVLFGPYSMVTLMANGLILAEARPVLIAAWYVKRFPTFSDAIASARRQLLFRNYFSRSGQCTGLIKIPRSSPDRRYAGDQDSSLRAGRIVPREAAKP
jgi:hypothetical protein